MNRLTQIALALLLAGCAHGKMGQIDQPLTSGAITKTTPIQIVSVSAKDMRVTGDKAADKAKVDGEREAIESMYAKRIAEALRKRGFNAMSVQGQPKGGIVLTGRATRFEHGSAAARILVGAGAGSSNLYSDFMIEDLDQKKTLSKFEVIATSGGRGGLGAAGSFMDEHMIDGAKKIAEYIEKGK